MFSTSRRGVALLEILVALVMVVLTGLGFVTLVQQTMTSLQVVQRTERDTFEASSILERLSLLDRQVLAQRMGLTRVRGLEVRLARLDAGLFAVAVTDTVSRRPLLETVLYVPER